MLLSLSLFSFYLCWHWEKNAVPSIHCRRTKYFIIWHHYQAANDLILKKFYLCNFCLRYLLWRSFGKMFEFFDSKNPKGIFWVGMWLYVEYAWPGSLKDPLRGLWPTQPPPEWARSLDPRIKYTRGVSSPPHFNSRSDIFLSLALFHTYVAHASECTYIDSRRRRRPLERT